ncbi:MAG: 2Fe-2S iron-sulfur cluster-binding protein [Campylobacterota bacterium]|nr:2Fe-2S iron-sulfur cluster-binding protein [Campylobacterota bacterium]
MKISICKTEYQIENKVNNLLNILLDIKATQNSSLAFRSGCKSGVCGSCAVSVNGVERLACKTIIDENDTIEPLKNSVVLKDLVVDISNQNRYLYESKAFLEDKNNNKITKEDEKKIDIESNCILCSSCFSSCPVYEVNPDFLGPFALTRVYRYINDKKENTITNKINTIQNNGIWDCTLCGNCNMVCPQQIDIKNDIIQLRNKSVQLGHKNPTFESFDSMSFVGNDDFGFNPNGF